MTGARVRRWAGPALGALVLGLLVWRFGADAFLDGVRRLDATAVAVAVGLGLVTTVAAARLFVDRRESAENEAGDSLLALREGAIAPGHIRAELGEVLTGAAPGRVAPDEITLFKSLGLAVEDLWAADHVFRKAAKAGVGTWVEF